MDKLKEILVNRFQEKNLAHFYLLRAHPSIDSPSVFMDKWVFSFLSEIVQKDLGLKNTADAKRRIENGISDLLFIDKPEDGKDYNLKSGEFDSLFEFQQFLPLELSWRFIIVPEAHRISTILSNKLLKTLEEPQRKTTIIFLCPGHQRLISTIESRAIQLNLIPENQNLNAIKELRQTDTFLKWLDDSTYSKGLKNFMEAWFKKSSPPHILIDKLKSKKDLQEELIQLLINWESEHHSSSQHKDDFMQNLKWFQQSKTFHNAPLERVFSILMQQFPY